MAQPYALSEALSIGGEELKRAFGAATRCLERYRDAVNSLNVFPVPDGDTGTNMLLTMRSGQEKGASLSDSSVGAFTEAVAHGTLLGARGNSGVILCQFLRGMAGALHGKTTISTEDLVHSFETGSQAAYGALSDPVEGTMLTVMREFAHSADKAKVDGASGPIAVWRAAVDGAREALARTPSQLPILKEAGVVDAGGQGFTILMEAMSIYLAGEEVDDHQFHISSPSGVGPSAGLLVHEEYLAGVSGQEYGHCIEFMLQGSELDLARIRQSLSAMGQSAGVAGSQTLARLHVHAPEPEPILAYARSLGEITQLKIDDIDEQRHQFVAHHQRQRKTSKIAIVAVVQGEGLAHIFRNDGCAVVVEGGQSMNPSTEELLEGARESGGGEIILLPNNSNVVLSANQAASLYGPSLHVVPSRTIPQGVAALYAFNQELPLEPNLKAMERALGEVKTIEVTSAVRDSTAGGLEVVRGQYIALADHELVAAGDSLETVLETAVSRIVVSPGSCVTLYWGADISEMDATAMVDRLASALPGVEVEMHRGGQPLYQYIVSVE